MTKQIIDKAESAILHTYNRFQVVFDHGKGVYLYDKDGKEYLLLNQYRENSPLEKITRYKDDGTTYETYGLLLYEVVNVNEKYNKLFDDKNEFIKLNIIVMEL